MNIKYLDFVKFHAGSFLLENEMPWRKRNNALSKISGTDWNIINTSSGQDIPPDNYPAHQGFHPRLPAFATSTDRQQLYTPNNTPCYVPHLPQDGQVRWNPSHREKTGKQKGMYQITIQFKQKIFTCFNLRDRLLTQQDKIFIIGCS